MKSTKQTPLGYLMGLLDVSLKDLGEYLYVAQTSISKWKTGARPLRPGSQHFAGTVEYFAMLTRDARRRERMTQLFARLFPDARLDTPEDYARCIGDFLEGKVLPTVAVRQALGEEARLYDAQVSVYRGEAGVQAAYGHLAAYLEERKDAAVCAMVDGDTAWLSRLLPALAAGRHLRILMKPPGADAVLAPLSGVLAHPQVETRWISGEGMPFLSDAVYCTAGADLLLRVHAPPGRPAYASIATDALTVEHAQLAFEAQWRACAPAFEAVAREQLDRRAFASLKDSVHAERVDWACTALPFLSMSAPLLMEVLKASGCSGRVWTNVMASQEALLETPIRLYLPVAALSGEGMRLSLLEMLCGRPISVTPAQAKRHLLDTAALLRTAGALRIVLRAARPSPGQPDAFAGRNAFAGYVQADGGALRVSRNPRFVEAMMGAMDALHADTTTEYRTQAYVAGLLERAALETS